MKANGLSALQQGVLMLLFVAGTGTTFSFNYHASRDSWIAMALAALLSLPLCLMYARIQACFPGRNLYDILLLCFGRVAGGVLSALFAAYALLVGAMVMRNFAEFISIVALITTPVFFLVTVIAVVCCYLASAGITGLGRWGIAVIGLLAVFVVVTLFTSVSHLHPDYLRPLLEHGWRLVWQNSFLFLLWPFGELVFFLTVSSGLRPSASPYKAYVGAAAVSGALLLLIYVRNLLVMGPALMQQSLYPMITAAKIASSDTIFGSVEITIAIAMIVSLLTKCAVTLYAAARGLSTLLRQPTRLHLLPSVAALMAALSIALLHNVVELVHFSQSILPYLQTFFQLLLPLAVWLAAELKKKLGAPPVSAK